MTAVDLPLALPGCADEPIIVRRATPDDLEALRDFYSQLDHEDRYRRFFSGGQPSTATITRWLTNPSGVVVLMFDGDEVIAEAGYALGEEGRADLGIAVAQRHRGWLGPFLVDLVLRLAAERGVRTMTADVLATNRAMVRLLAARGYALLPSDDLSVVRLLVGTNTNVPPWPDTGDRRRVLVEVPGGRWGPIDALVDAGYAVVACPGPAARQRWGCPVLQGKPCPLVAEADVVVTADAALEEQLGSALARTHPRVPRVPPANGSLVERIAQIAH